MSIKSDNKIYYTTQEVADMFGVSGGMVRVWVSKRMLACEKFGTANYFNMEQIRAFDASQREQGKRGMQPGEGQKKRGPSSGPRVKYTLKGTDEQKHGEQNSSVRLTSESLPSRLVLKAS